ncbi:MAG: hypothetical protein HYT48_03020 [Candidatus Vogelbacteria bacterium]|nr:hypothetical protein [Candidatus Vogelbacteria bacterium]
MNINAKKTKFGPVGQKAVLLLAAGVTLGLTRSPRRYFRILRLVAKEWRAIDRYALHRAIKKLYQSRLVAAENHPDGTTTIILTQAGKQLALRYDINRLKIPPMKRWDYKWRVVLFDIPERHKRARDALALALKQAGFHSFQKSVFVHPFECRHELDWVVEFFNLRPYVRFILAEAIDNELHLKKHFGLV